MGRQQIQLGCGGVVDLGRRGTFELAGEIGEVAGWDGGGEPLAGLEEVIEAGRRDTEIPVIHVTNLHRFPFGSASVLRGENPGGNYRPWARGVVQMRGSLRYGAEAPSVEMTPFMDGVRVVEMAEVGEGCVLPCLRRETWGTRFLGAG